MRKYYNPDLSADEVEALDAANWLCLQTAQAFLGSISPNFVAVAVEPKPNASAVVHVALERDVGDDMEAVDEALGDLDNLLEGHFLLDRMVLVRDTVPLGWFSLPYRQVFRRRP